MRKEIVEAIEKRLKQLVVSECGCIEFVGEDVLARMEEEGTVEYAIKHFDLWNRQVEFMEEEEIYDFPAVFIELGKIKWRHQADGTQDAPLLIGLHVLTRWEPKGYGRNFMYLDVLDKINLCLNGFRGDCFNSMARVESIPCHDYGEILDNTEVFETFAVDKTAVKSSVKLTGRTKLNLNLLKK